MNTTIKDVLIFTVGALVGSAVGYKLTKDLYVQRNQEDYEAMKEWFENRERKLVEKHTEKKEPEVEKKEQNEMSKNIAIAQGYVDYSKISEPEKPTIIESKEVKDVYIPYVIPPDDFGECMDYEKISLTHYSDGILTDDDNNPIEDVEGLVGLDYDTHFGEYEDDSVFIRNDEIKTDFEILADPRRYSDVVHYGARRTED